MDIDLTPDEIISHTVGRACGRGEMGVAILGNTVCPTVAVSVPLTWFVSKKPII